MESNQKPSFKEWFHEKVDNAKKVPKKAWEFVKENEGPIAAGIALVGTIVEVVIHKEDLQEALEERKRYTDPDTGLTWDLNRALTNKENREISDVKRNGGDVEAKLDELNVLK